MKTLSIFLINNMGFNWRWSLVWMVLVLTSLASLLLLKGVVNPDANAIISYLSQLKSFNQYFSDLVSLRTVDVQPLRDLSLIFDVIIFKKFGLNLTLYQNIFIWFLCSNVIFLLIKRLYPSVNQRILLLIVLLYSVYPLMINVVAWGIARKHLLAFFFILLATYTLVRARGERSTFFLIGLLYLMSLLSQPIHVLWPLWAILYSYFYARENIRRISLFTLPLMLIFTIVNFIYYKFSPIFKILYQSKEFDLEKWADVILAWGHYTSQIFFPFDLTYIYPLGSVRQFFGISLFVVIIFIFNKFIKDKKFLVTWSFFSILPVLVISSTPFLLMDSYLILPTLGVIILMLKIIPEESIILKRKHMLFASIILIIFTALNFQDSKKWTSPVFFTNDAFEKRPSCQSALRAAGIALDLEGVISNNLITYLEKFDCIRITKKDKMTESQLNVFIKFNSQLIYYDKNIPIDRKLSSLRAMTNKSRYPFLPLAALLADGKNDDEIEQIFRPLDKNDGNGQSEIFDRIVANHLYPYCQEHRLLNCLNATKGMVKKVERMWY